MSDCIYECLISSDDCEKIEKIITEPSTKNRTFTILAEEKALTDGDNLFIVLPAEPVLLSLRYIAETNGSIETSVNAIYKFQGPPLDQSINFYSTTARDNYGAWATMNIDIWRIIQSSISDPDVQNVLSAL